MWDRDGSVRGNGCADCVGRADCFFCHLEPGGRETIMGLVTERSVNKGDILQKQGDRADRLQVVKVGHLLCRRRAISGQQHPVAFVGRGEVLGAAAPWGEPNALTCEAASPVRVCEVWLGQIERFELMNGPFFKALGRAQAQSFSRLADWSHAIRLKGVSEQVAGVLCLLTRSQHSQVVLLPSHVVLAEMIGSSREAVARAIKQLQSQGRIARRDRWYCEVRPSVLDYCRPAA